ncbi:hypothetical protein M9Y10_036579 [Tritrichomonas musculus]|uniref:Protein kinase domain-containing protein n=1 Tax=Tritrichomonas musculus TaxID=1915356 RepID=A0ABR2GJL5_9EUKA
MEPRLIDEVPNHLFSDLEQIGTGSYSDIFTAIHIKTNSKVVLKIIPKSKNLDYIDKEISIHKTLNHPFICKYFTSFNTEHLTIIVMEFIEGINSLEYVNKYKGIPTKEAQNIFAQLVIALEYLHDQSISHRDLKLENIMIDNFGHIRLIDFGFSSLKTVMSTCCGSVPYSAPEILSGDKYTNKSDIWSLGVILYALLCGHLPFYHTNIQLMAMIICSNEAYIPPTLDPSARDLIKKMLIKDPYQRISLDGIKNHQFVKQTQLFRINYKQLFSPAQKTTEIENINRSSSKVVFVSNDQPKEELSKNSNCMTFNISLNKPHLNCYRVRNRRISMTDLKPKAPEIVLREKITSNTNSVDESILSRKDFALNLNKLIEMSIIKL